MELINYTEIDNSFLKAKFDVYFENMGMTIKGFSYIQKGSSRWLNMPSTTYEKDGETKRKYYVYFDKEKKAQFEKACFDRIDKGLFKKFEQTDKEE